MAKYPPNCKHEFEAKEEQTPGQKWAESFSCPFRYKDIGCPLETATPRIKHIRGICTPCKRIATVAIDHYLSAQRPEPKPQQPPEAFLEANEKFGTGPPFNPQKFNSDRDRAGMWNATLDAAKEAVISTYPLSGTVSAFNKAIKAIDSLKVVVS